MNFILFVRLQAVCDIAKDTLFGIEVHTVASIAEFALPGSGTCGQAVSAVGHVAMVLALV